MLERGTEGTSLWLTCWSPIFLDFVIFIYRGILNSNSPLIMGILSADTVEMANQD